MSMPWPRWPLLLASVLAGPALAGEKLTPLPPNTLTQLQVRELSRVQQSLASLKEQSAKLGLKPGDDFQLSGAHTDRFGITHSHFRQYHQGLPVWGAMAITHLDSAGTALPVTANGLRRGIRVATNPTVDAASAISLATLELDARGPLGNEPTAELVVYPVTRQVNQAPEKPYAKLNAADFADEVVGYTLAWHVHTELDNPENGVAHTDFILDARTGEVLKKWDSLETVASTGKGRSQYSGEVQINTWKNAAGVYEMRDTTRTYGEGLRTFDVARAEVQNGAPATLTLYTDPDNTWGDGQNYVQGGPTLNDNGQTAAVDAHYGLLATWDYYLKIHGRLGIDNKGTPTYNRVHVGNAYNNAFWTNSCFCMSYGDGSYNPPATTSGFKSMASLDVSAHELSHGVMSQTAGLIYAGESGGLNEANSDIFGTMTEFWVRNGRGNTIGNTGANWMMGEDLHPSGPLRFMDKPGKDKLSPEAWYPGINNIDVHHSSGPMNRAFYFLAQGADAETKGGDHTSRYLPAGMVGIGNDKAAAIWYRAITVYLFPSANYNAARTASLLSAADLFGTQSAEYRAVRNAFTAINVGSTANTYDDFEAPAVTASVSGTSPRLQLNATATDNVGVTRVEFYVDNVLLATDTSLPFSVALDGAVLTDGTHQLALVAYDKAGNFSESEPAPFSVSAPFTQLLTDPGFEKGGEGWEADPRGNINYPTTGARTGRGYVWLNGYGTVHKDNLYQDVTLPASAARTTLSFFLYLTSDEPSTAVNDWLDVQVRTTSGELLETLATYTNKDTNLGWVQRSFDLSAYAGQTIRIYLEGNENASLATSFRVDDFAVRTLGGRDTQAPSVVARADGTTTQVHLSAEVMDDGHLGSLEFFVDGASVGTATQSHLLILNTTSMTNGWHTLVARATDMGGNATDSAPVRFYVDATLKQVVQNPGFENTGNLGVWARASTVTGGIGFFQIASLAHTGQIFALFRGELGAGTSSMRQTVTIPADATSAVLSFWVQPYSSAFTDGQVHDTFKVKLRNTSGAELVTLKTLSNLDTADTYVEQRIDLAAYRGQTVQLFFEAIMTAPQIQGGFTRFFLDDITLDTSFAEDKQAPALTASVTGTYGPIVLNANVRDNIWTSKLEFFVDGTPVTERMDAAGTYQVPFDASTLSNGTHQLRVKATDTAGNVGELTVDFGIQNSKVVDQGAPVVTPMAQSLFEVFTLRADASDDTGVTSVEYYVDGAFVGQSSQAPYEVTYMATLLTEGEHTVKAVAYDRYGNAGEATTTINVVAPFLTLSPARVVVALGGTARFSASVENARDTTVAWGVKTSPIPCGTITSAGTYTAGNRAGVCHVVATSNAIKSTSATATVITYTGDLNRDGVVDGEDMGLMAQSYGTDSSEARPADLDADSAVNDNDVTLFVSQFGR
jgi:Zn-dependent metalloprotease